MAEWWDDPDITPSAKQAPPVTKEDVQAQQAEDADSTNDTWGHFVDYISGQASHVLDDTAGFFGDAVTEGGKLVWQQARHGMQGLQPEDLKDIHLPGFGSASKATHKVHDKVIGPDLPARSKTEQRVGTVVRGVADMIPSVIGAPGAAGRILLSGATGGAGAEAAGEVFPDSEIAPLIGGLIGGAGPHVIESGIRSARTGRMINEGMKHPDWAAVNDVIVNDLEGGGSLAHPKRSPKGAMGPQQVMPETARKPGFGIRPWDGKSQADLARVGRQYSAAMMSKYDGDPAKVLAAYNAGPGRVDHLIKKYGDAWDEHLPHETKTYIRKGLGKLGRGPEDLGPIRMVEDEQPSIDDQAFANKELSPSAEVIPFPEDRMGFSPNEAARIRSEDIDAAYEQGQLTAAERQEMDASVEEAPSLNKANDRLDQFSTDQVPPEAANDPVEVANHGVLQTLKDLWNDESGSIKGNETPPEDPTSWGPVDKLRQALKAARPLREEQERQYSKERSARASKAADVQQKTSGEAGFYAEKEQLGGVLPKVGYESIRGQFKQEDIDHLFDLIKTSPRLSFFDQISARDGLAKMIGAQGENFGTVPTNSEIRHLSKVLPKDIIDELMRKRGSNKILENVANGLNIPRSIMASFDLSAPLRQGVVLVGRKEFWGSFVKMFHQWGSETAFKAVQDEIASRPTFSLMRQAKLSLTGMDHLLTDREEAFMSDWAEKIPVLGRGVHASNRAYVGFLNKLRADTFDSLVKQAKEAGIDFADNPKALKDIGAFLNNATGRGSLGKLTQSAPILNSLFFSPRLMASRLNLLFNAKMYVQMDPFVRKQVMKSMLSFAGIALTLTSLAAMGGAKVERDPRSADFGKIRVGHTRYDISGGFQPYVRIFAQLLTGKQKNSNTGKVSSLTSGKFGRDTRFSKALDFLRSKESPVASLVDDLASYPRTRFGQKVTVKNEIPPMFIPLVIQDIHDAVVDQGAKGLIMGVPAIFGVGVQTYKPKKKKERVSSSKSAKQWWED